MANASANATMRKLLKNVSGFSANALIAALPALEIASPAPKLDRPIASPALIAMPSLSYIPELVLLLEL